MNAGTRGTQDGSSGAASFGEILKGIARKEGITGKALKGRRLAAKVICEQLGLGAGAEGSGAPKVVALRTGMVLLEVDSAALLQEIESFQRAKLVQALNAAGLKVREIRVRLPKGR